MKTYEEALKTSAANWTEFVDALTSELCGRLPQGAGVAWKNPADVDDSNRSDVVVQGVTIELVRVIQNSHGKYFPHYDLIINSGLWMGSRIRFDGRTGTHMLDVLARKILALVALENVA